MAKVYRVVLVVVDANDELGGSQECRDILENTKYPNWCMAPDVLSVQERDIGEWSDESPFNSSDRPIFVEALANLFNGGN